MERLEIMAKNQHVVLRDGMWAVLTEDSTVLPSVYNSKQEAIDAAREIAKKTGRNLFVHGRSNQVLHGSAAPTTLNEDALRKAVRSLFDSTVAKKGDGGGKPGPRKKAGDLSGAKNRSTEA